MDERKFDYYPLDLTASEQQRVGIARALVTRPAFVVLDEPTSMLDPSARAELLSLLQKMQRELGYRVYFHFPRSHIRRAHQPSDRDYVSRPHCRAGADVDHHGAAAASLIAAPCCRRCCLRPGPTAGALRHRRRDPDCHQPTARMSALRALPDPRGRLPRRRAAAAGDRARAFFGMPEVGTCRRSLRASACWRGGSGASNSATGCDCRSISRAASCC